MALAVEEFGDTADAPRTVIKSNDKKRARQSAMRRVLNLFAYENMDAEVVGQTDRLIAGPASQLFEDGEQLVQQFPQL